MKRPAIMHVFFLVTITVVVVSCSGGTVLRTKRVQEKSVSGPFDVVLFSRNDFNRLLTVAILDVAGDRYEIRPFSPEFNFKVVKNVEGENAFKSAVDFIRGHQNYLNYNVIRILDENGGAIGYEIRPLYMPATYGISDVMHNNYRLTDNGKVVAYIVLKEEVKRLFEQQRR